MFRTNGQFFAPAKTALPPSMAVVCRDHMTSHGCDLLESADGTGSTLLDNAWSILS